MTLILRGNQFCKSIALKRSFTKQHIYDTFIALGWITVSEIIMKTNVKQKEKTILKLKEFSLLTTKWLLKWNEPNLFINTLGSLSLDELELQCVKALSGPTDEDADNGSRAPRHDPPPLQLTPLRWITASQALELVRLLIAQATGGVIN